MLKKLLYISMEHLGYTHKLTVIISQILDKVIVFQQTKRVQKQIKEELIC